MPHTTTGIEAIVCQDIAARQELGIKKYGLTVADNPLSHRDWLKHAYEEALDMAIYLRRSIAALDAAPSEQPEWKRSLHHDSAHLVFKDGTAACGANNALGIQWFPAEETRKCKRCMGWQAKENPRHRDDEG